MYFGLLEAVGASTPLARWCAFQLLTPLVKCYHLRTAGLYTHNMFVFSMVHDLILSTLFFGFVAGLRGVRFMLAMPVVFPLLSVLEWIGFKLLLPEAKYVVKPIDWVGQVATFAVGGAMSLTLGLTADQGTRPLHHDFVAFICVLLWTDLQFGVTHCMCHRVLWLWKRHKIHHEYGKGELNSMANVHGDALDEVLMNGVLVLPILACGWFRLYPSTLPFLEWFYLIPFSHLRFQPSVVNLMAFFEFDLLDMLLCQPRMGAFHTIHHEVVAINFSVFGIFPDSVCRAIAGKFSTLGSTTLQS